MENGDLETWRHGDLETWIHGDMDMETWRHQTKNGKRKPRQFSLICFPFAHHVNVSLSFVRLLTKKQTKVYPFANRLNGLNGLAHRWINVTNYYA